MTTPISSPTSSTFASTIATTVWNRAEFKPSQSGNNQEEKLRPSAVVILHPQRQALPLEYTLFLEPHTWSSWTERWRNQLGLSPGDKGHLCLTQSPAIHQDPNFRANPFDEVTFNKMRGYRSIDHGTIYLIYNRPT